MAGRASLKKGWSKLVCEKMDLKEGRGFARQPGGTRFQGGDKAHKARTEMSQETR